MQEDAYDAVKTHMFELLAAVAAVCQPSQLDMLFAKLERRQARSVQDAERLLTLLATLAEGDHEVGLTWSRCESGAAALRGGRASVQPTQCVLLGNLLYGTSCRGSMHGRTWKHEPCLFWQAGASRWVYVMVLTFVRCMNHDA